MNIIETIILILCIINVENIKTQKVEKVLSTYFVCLRLSKNLSSLDQKTYCTKRLKYGHNYLTSDDTNFHKATRCVTVILDTKSWHLLNRKFDVFNQYLTHLMLVVLLSVRCFHLSVKYVTRFCGQFTMTYPGNIVNMVDCGNLRCYQERRLIKKDLMSWSKKIPLIVGKYVSSWIGRFL